MDTSNNTAPVPAGTVVRKRKSLSPERKLNILDEVKGNPQRQAEILRREGLFRSDLVRFEQIAREGALTALRDSRPGRKKRRQVDLQEYEQVTRELATKEKAMADLTVELTVLKKKVNGE